MKSIVTAHVTYFQLQSYLNIQLQSYFNIILMTCKKYCNCVIP